MTENYAKLQEIRAFVCKNFYGATCHIKYTQKFGKTGKNSTKMAALEEIFCTITGLSYVEVCAKFQHQRSCGLGVMNFGVPILRGN